MIGWHVIEGVLVLLIIVRSRTIFSLERVIRRLQMQHDSDQQTMKELRDRLERADDDPRNQVKDHA